MAWESISKRDKATALLFCIKYPLGFWALTSAIFTLLLLFLNFPLMTSVYAVGLSGLVLAVWIGKQWYQLKQKYQTLRQLDETTIARIVKQVDDSDLIMQIYLKQYEALLKQQAVERREFQQHLEEQKDYFTLWLHQIKTPISSISLLLQNDSLANSSQKIEHELIYLNDYTHMGLNYLKLSDTGHELDLTLVEVDPLIRNMLKKYASLFIYNHILINYSPLNLTVLSDAKWLQVLLEQILSNALKYTPAGGEITITVENTSKLVIKDTGIGIHPNDLPKIFEKGYSGLNGRMQDKSTGLGLFLVRKICKRLNYTNQIESAVSQGTVVSLETRRDAIELFD